MGDCSAEPYILIYGADARLLETRQWVLESAMFEVASASTSSEAERLLNERAPAVLVLCHSLTVKACEWVVKAAASLSPRTRRLILDGKAAPVMKERCHTVFDAREGAVALISTVRRMIDDCPKQRAPLEIVARGR